MQLNFEVLSGKLTLDISHWVNALKLANQAVQKFTDDTDKLLKIVKSRIDDAARPIQGLINSLKKLPQPAPAAKGPTAGPAAGGEGDDSADPPTSTRKSRHQPRRRTEEPGEGDSPDRDRQPPANRSQQRNNQRDADDAATTGPPGANSALIDDLVERLNRSTTSPKNQSAANRQFTANDEAAIKAEEKARRQADVEFTNQNPSDATKAFRGAPPIPALSVGARGFNVQDDEPGNQSTIPAIIARLADAANAATQALQDIADKATPILNKALNIAAGAARNVADNAQKLGIDLGNLAKIEQQNAFQAMGAAPSPDEGQNPGMQHFALQATTHVINQFAQLAEGAAIKAAMGPAQLNQLIADAKAKGDPLGALDLIIGNVAARKRQADFNLGVLARDSTGGPSNAFPGADNSAYLKSTGNPAAVAAQYLGDLLATLQQQRADLAAQAAHSKRIPHLAAGGIVTTPRTALIGEQGPEAVIPLTNLFNLLQGVAGHTFQSLQGFFQQAQGWANQSGNMAWLNEIAATQDRALRYLTAYQEHRQIDLQPLSGSRVFGDVHVAGQRQAGRARVYNGDTAESSAGPTFVVYNHFASTDLTTDQQKRQVAESLMDHIDQAAKRRGVDMTGGSALRSMPRPSNAAPTAFAR